MIGYLVRRLIQMAFVVLLATAAIYSILNLAPGGPMAGLNQIGDRKLRFSEADKARLEAYLGLDKPFALRYLVWLVGEDWLGADYVYLGLTPTDEKHEMRFYSDPGIAYTSKGYDIWFEGEEVGTRFVAGIGLEEDADVAVYQASKVWIRPEGEAAENVIAGTILDVEGFTIKLDVKGKPYNVIIETSRDTAWEATNAPEKPAGAWLRLSWLFGANGLFGKYAHFHGTGHGVLRLDFGTSWNVARGQNISMLIQSRLKNTVMLMLTSTVLSLLVAIPIGIYSAVKQYSVIDYVVTTFTFFGTAMPVFWLGLVMILIFTLYFQKWGIPYLPAGDIASVRTPPTGSLLRFINATPGGFMDHFVHLIMPTLTLSLLSMATWSRYMRSSMLEVLRQDYVRTARAKGLAERLVIVKHAMRNALIPIVTIVVFTIPGVFGGAVITESIFSWQGMGSLYFKALGADDWPVVMVILFIQSVLTVVATLVGDVLYTIVDPRIRYN